MSWEMDLTLKRPTKNVKAFRHFRLVPDDQIISQENYFDAGTAVSMKTSFILGGLIRLA